MANFQNGTPPAPIPPLPPFMNPKCSIFLGDLHPQATESDLFRVFSTIGPVDSIHICRDRITFESLCFAYLSFCLSEHAEEALKYVTHVEYWGKPVKIISFNEDRILLEPGFPNVFIKNLDFSVNEVQLDDMCTVFGRIIWSKIVRDGYCNSKGYAYVQFDSDNSAKRAISLLNGSIHSGRKLMVEKFVDKNKEFTKVYVKNLDENYTVDSLKEKFSEYGKITNAAIMKNGEGKSRGFGFVNFELHKDAKKAVDSLNGAVIGSKIWVVEQAMMRAERDAVLQRNTGA